VAQLWRTERRPEPGDERRTQRVGSDTCQASAHQPSSIESEAVVLEDPDKIWVVRLYLFLFAIDGLVRFEDRTMDAEWPTSQNSPISRPAPIRRFCIQVRATRPAGSVRGEFSSSSFSTISAATIAGSGRKRARH
jgi:hypothetical protein